MAQPSDEDVDQVIAFTGFTDRNLIVAALKAKNNNLDQVVNEIFDDQTKFITTYGWDDTAFAPPREGTPNSQIPSFAIHTADDAPVLEGVDPNYYQGQIGAPSRPPSRTNNRSPLSRMVDYTASNTTGSNLPPTSVEQEDAQLRQAIAASVATSNMQLPQPQPQESGVIDTDTGLPHFGPANRPDYNQNEWAMVTLNHDKPEPDPSRRKREPGVPAFLRCRTDNAWEKHRLGAIITILHSIPAARNALLRYGVPPPYGYGHDSEWWKGKAILPPAAQPAHESGELNWGDEPKTKWSDELHRLMAFLDATDRSYGTADVLADAQPEGSPSSTDTERDFFEHLRADPDYLETLASLISTCRVASIYDDEAPYTHTDRFGLLDFPHSKEQLTLARSLYSLWDLTFFMDFKGWEGDPSAAQCALITDPADVLTMRLSGDDGLPKPIEIPEIFYLDRYLAFNREEISKIQRHLHILAQALVRAERAERRATIVIDPETNAEVNRIDLNKAAIAILKKKRTLVKLWALWRMHEEERDRTGVEPQTLLPPDTPDEQVQWTEDEMRNIRFLEAKVLQLQFELARVEDEVAGIHRDRDIVIRAHLELERRLTVPCEKLGIQPQHPYKLRGVTSSVDTFYVCVRAEPDLMEMDETDAEARAPDQWWKLGYVANDDAPVKAEMTTFEKVVEEACGVGSKPILIYASEKAMTVAPDPLSDALQTFVRFDNHLFKKELLEENPRDKKRGGFASPASPSKRLNRASSVDSMASNAASAGDFDHDVDDDMRDAPFEAEDPFLVGDGAAEVLPDLIDTSVPEPQPPHLYHGDGRKAAAAAEAAAQSAGNQGNSRDESSSSSPSTVGREPVRQRLAGVSLDEVAGRGPPASRVPEMQERGGAAPPFLLAGVAASAQQANGRPVGGASMDMELDEKAHEDGDGTR